MPDIFVPATGEDDIFYHIGDDKVDRCLREAVKYAGRERFDELKSDNGWTDFLVKSRDQGLVGSDTNQDCNSVRGLADHVKYLAEHDDPPLDPDTEERDTCNLLVQRLISDELLDEVILSWADNKGHLEHQPQTSSQVERRDADTDVIPPHHFYAHFNPLDIDIDELIKWIRNNGKTPHLPRSITVPGNSSHAVERVAVDVDDYGLPARITVPDWNFSIPFNWTVNGTLLPGNSTVIRWSTLKFNSTRPDEGIPIVRPIIVPVPEHFLPENSTLISRPTKPLVDTRSLEPGEKATGWITHPDTQYPKPMHQFDPSLLDHIRNLTFHGNSKLHGRRVAGRSSDSAVSTLTQEYSKLDLYDPRATSNLTLPEVAMVVSILDPEIFDLFRANMERVNSFYNTPGIADGLHEAMRDELLSHRGLKFMSKVLKNFVEKTIDNSFLGP